MNPNALLQLDIKQAQRFLSALSDDDIFTFQAVEEGRPGKRGGGVVLHGTLAQHWDQLVKLNRLGWGIFVMINEGDGIVHGDHKTCRTKASVIKVRAFFADLDGAPLQPVYQPRHPDMIVESSPGKWHVYWRVLDCPLEDFSRVQRELAQRYNGDKSVHDLPRVLRLPGFFHMKKRDMPFMSRIYYLEDD